MPTRSRSPKKKQLGKTKRPARKVAAAAGSQSGRRGDVLYDGSKTDRDSNFMVDVAAPSSAGGAPHGPINELAEFESAPSFSDGEGRILDAQMGM